jgi:hypothetical protein
MVLSGARAATFLVLPVRFEAMPEPARLRTQQKPKLEPLHIWDSLSFTPFRCSLAQSSQSGALGPRNENANPIRYAYGYYEKTSSEPPQFNVFCPYHVLIGLGKYTENKAFSKDKSTKEKPIHFRVTHVARHFSFPFRGARRRKLAGALEVLLRLYDMLPCKSRISAESKLPIRSESHGEASRAILLRSLALPLDAFRSHYHSDRMRPRFRANPIAVIEADGRMSFILSDGFVKRKSREQNQHDENSDV